MITTLISAALLSGTLTIPPPSFKTERTLLYTAATLDIISTRLAINNGGYEANPLLGRNPSNKKLVVGKLLAVAVIELTNHYLKKKHAYGRVKFNYWIGIIMWGVASYFNFQGAFK